MIRFILSVMVVGVLLASGCTGEKGAPKSAADSQIQESKTKKARKKPAERTVTPAAARGYGLDSRNPEVVPKAGVDFDGVWKFLDKKEKAAVNAIFKKNQRQIMGSKYTHKHNRNEWGAPNFKKIWYNLTGTEKAIVDLVYSKYHRKQ